MERQFKGIWIPAEIWLNMDLSAIDKILLADIDSFTGNGKMFYKSIATIAKELGVSESTIKRAIKALLDKNLIRVSGGTRKRLCESLMRFKSQNDLIKGQNELDKGQIDPSLGSKCTPTNTITNSTTNSTTKIVYPFDSDLFIEKWNLWKDYKKQEHKFKYKSALSEQAALKRLTQLANTEDDAIRTIEHAISQGWKGFYSLDNKLPKHKRATDKDFNTDEYTNYLNSLDS